MQREPEVFAAAVRVRTAASLSRHNSETTSKPYPIPNTYEEEEAEEEERVKFNEIRSGVLNKISGLESLARVPSFLPSFPPSRPPVRTDERRHKKRWVGVEQGWVGRIIRTNQEIPPSKLKSLLFMTPGMVPEEAPPSSTPESQWFPQSARGGNINQSINKRKACLQDHIMLLYMATRQVVAQEMEGN